MTQVMKKAVLATAISATGLMMTHQASAFEIGEFMKEGDVIAQLRTRVETVEEDNTKEDAVAMTARARLGYETASMAGFKVLAEVDQVIALQDEYESKSTVGPNPDEATSVVADGAATDINRAQISYTMDGFQAIVGRQRIIFDNARFVGNVGWRQNEQTYDAARLDVTAVDDLKASYAYVSQVNDIFYNDVEVKNHLLNLGYSGLDFGKVSAYAYLLEDDESEATNDTFGLSFKGKTALDSVDVLYSAEYATQTVNDGSDGAEDFDASYNLIEAGAKVSGITFVAGQETLSGDGDYAFETPLATKHAFNGWADKFLGTNNATGAKGLKDAYAKVVTKVSGVKLLAMYHDYSTDKDGDDLGSEINVLAAKKFNKNFNAGVKFAQYSAGDTGFDTDKLWVWAEAKF